MLVIISGILHIKTINPTTIASFNNALFILIPPKTKKCAAEATHRKMHSSADATQFYKQSKYAKIEHAFLPK